jgi:hypothetical protein
MHGATVKVINVTNLEQDMLMDEQIFEVVQIFRFLGSLLK